MRTWLVSGVCLAFWGAADQGQASAWPQAPGHTQVIASLEPGGAQWAYGASGAKTLALTRWDQTDLSVYVDHGVSRRFSVTAKVNFKTYHTDSERFSGLGSLELGGRWTMHQGDDYVLALGASLEAGGHGRRNDFDTDLRAATDYDLRAYVGKSFIFGGHNSFINLEAARHLRSFEANQWRLESTFGIKSNKNNGMIMLQAFAGQTDPRSGFQSKWLNVEASLVHPLGPGSLQVGLRKTVLGQNVPAVTALIVSVWRSF